MASPSSGATERGRSFGRRASFSSTGVVLVIRTDLQRGVGDALQRGPGEHAVDAGGEHPLRRPLLFRASTVLVSVPAVSMMSSTIRALQPLDVADDVHDLGLVGRRCGACR